jgi:hypothetical protein
MAAPLLSSTAKKKARILGALLKENIGHARHPDEVTVVLKAFHWDTPNQG